MRPSSQQAASATPIFLLASEVRTAHSAATVIPGAADRNSPLNPTTAVNVLPCGADAGPTLGYSIVPDRHLLSRTMCPEAGPLNQVLSHWREAESPLVAQNFGHEYQRESVTKYEMTVRTKTVTSPTTYSAMLLKITKDIRRVVRSVNVEQTARWLDSEDVYWQSFSAVVQRAKEANERHRIVDSVDDTNAYKLIRPSTVALGADWLKPTIRSVEGTTHGQMALLFRLLGKTIVADRIEELLAIAEEDQDEPHMSIESLRNFGRFLIAEQELIEPNIGVTPNGLVQTQWSTQGNGVVVMEFLVSGFVRFSAISAPAKRGVKRKAVRGTLEHKEMLDALQLFSAQLFSR